MRNCQCSTIISPLRMQSTCKLYTLCTNEEFLSDRIYILYIRTLHALHASTYPHDMHYTHDMRCTHDMHCCITHIAYFAHNSQLNRMACNTFMQDYRHTHTYICNHMYIHACMHAHADIHVALTHTTVPGSALHFITIHYIILHCIILPCITLHTYHTWHTHTPIYTWCFVPYTHFPQYIYAKYPMH